MSFSTFLKQRLNLLLKLPLQLSHMLGMKVKRVKYKYRVTKEVKQNGTYFYVYLKRGPFWTLIHTCRDEHTAWSLTGEEIIGYREVRRPVEEREEAGEMFEGPVELEMDPDYDIRDDD